MPSEMDVYLRLGLAFAIGLMIGIERGWRARDAVEGRRAAGVRTFALVGLAGGVFGLVGTYAGDSVLAIGTAAISLLFGAAYVLRALQDKDRDLTPEVAAVVTYALGVMAVRGDMTLAAAASVIVVATLAVKESAHRWVAALEQAELQAAIKVLVISVVVLPFVPDRGFGPGGVLNPYEIWWIVALLSGLSLFGYGAIRLAGPRAGVLLLGILGGLASSTATTINAARIAARSPASAPYLSAGIAAAVSVMFLRVIALFVALQPTLAWQIALPLGTSAIMGGALALMWSRHATAHAAQARIDSGPPADIGGALKFAALLTIITLATELAREWMGAGGVLGAAALSGAVDVDAVAVAMARVNEATATLTDDIRVRAVMLAILVNSVAKAGYAVAIAGRPMLKTMLILLSATALPLVAGIVSVGG